jgi:2-oxo-3-hexenedioate decarboxylase
MSEPIDKELLARTLIEAAAKANGIQPLTNTWPDLDPVTAYEIQDAVVQARIDAGQVIVGAKTGLTSKAKQQQMNVGEPLSGILTDDMQIDAGEPLVCSRFIQPRCEVEIAFLLKKDLEGPQVMARDVIAATDLVFAAVDVIDSRFTGYKFTYQDVIADNCSCAGFVLGGQGVDPRGFDLRLVGATLEKNGQLIHTAAGAAVMGHPAGAVAWLVRKLAVRGRGLTAGHVVMCGALTEAVAVQPGDSIVARFDRLGTVEIACV